MVESGVPHSAEVIEKFTEMKVQRSIKYMVCKIENESEIIVEHMGGPDETWENC